MIDLHNHLLGEGKWEGSLEGALQLCERARRDGVEEIAVTLRLPKGPKELEHFSPEGKLAQPWADRRLLQEVQSRVGAQPKLSRGYEWTFSQDLPARLRHFPGAPTINESAYLLLSLPALQAPTGYEQVLAELVADGFVPIIAHPECSRAIRREAAILARLIKLGALIQLDALSLLGGYGVEVGRFARRLLERGQAHFIATHADQGARREVSLSAACAAASRIIGRDAARRLVKENPQAVLANAAVAEASAPGRRLPMLKAALNSWG
jgi:protein-tyrosine phosphatase